MGDRGDEYLDWGGLKQKKINKKNQWNISWMVFLNNQRK